MMRHETRLLTFLVAVCLVAASTPARSANRGMVFIVNKVEKKILAWGSIKSNSDIRLKSAPNRPGSVPIYNDGRADQTTWFLRKA